MNILNLKKKCTWIRQEVLKAAEKSGKAHIGGTFSAVEILVALYYGGIIKFNPKRPDWVMRDRFILSKGHACSALYAIFLDLSVLTKNEYESYGQNGGLGGQLESTISGVDFNTGSIGHSVGVCVGMALAAKIQRKNFRSFTLIGDSEFYEGSIWESLIFAQENNVTNVIVIIDRNRLMVTDIIDDSGLYQNFRQKVEDFGWAYFECDGHDLNELVKTLKNIGRIKKPSILVANTVKGKGVSLFENNMKWHNSMPSAKDLEIARTELLNNQ